MPRGPARAPGEGQAAGEPASVAAAAKTIEADGGPDVLVNNAGIETRTSDNGVGYFDASGRLPW